jgi:hypothetical protein
MSFHRDLVNKIKSNKRDEVYILLKQIIDLINLNLNENEFKQNHADMLLSFLADEKEQKLIPNHFNVLLALYAKNNWQLNISSYALIIRILCNLHRFNEALDYLNDVERHNLPIKTRLISPFFDSLINKDNDKGNQGNILEDNDVSRNGLLILVDLFDRYPSIMTINEFNNLLIKFHEYVILHHILDTKISSIIKETINEFLKIWITNDLVIPRMTFDLLLNIKNYTELKHYSINDSLLEKYITEHSSFGFTCQNCNTNLKKHILEHEQKDILNSQLISSHPNSQKSLTKFQKWILEYKSKIKTNDIVYILDGGNIGHSLYAEFSIKAIIKIIQLIKNKYRENRENQETQENQETDKINDKLHILLVLHKRHKEALDKAQLIDDDILSIYLTPPNHNDDLFWMLSSLMFDKSFIISNDLMRDHHVNKLDETLFNIWKETHLVTYNIHTNEFNYPSEHTLGIQTYNNGIHIPILENDKINWVCLSKTHNE